MSIRAKIFSAAFRWKGILQGAVLVFCFCWSSTMPLNASVAVDVRPDIESGVYEPGQLIKWKISVLDDGKPVPGRIQYTVHRGGAVPIDSGSLELRQGRTEVTNSRVDPGVLLVEVKFKPTGQAELIKYGGAVVEMGKIAPSKGPPNDFDSFWKSKIAELHAVPMNVKLQQVNVGDPTIEYYKITMDNIRGTKIYGQLAKPAGEHQVPAMLAILWAGIFPLHPEWVCANARQGWLTMMINPHNLPIDQPESFYQEKSSGELSNYFAIGNDDREKCYFLRMFLGTHRALDYLANHRNWNKRSLLVQGSSQGGYESIVAAGLHQAVTGFFALNPTGCDTSGGEVGRIPCWPNWGGFAWPKDPKKVMQTARYFDAMNFAPRIHCRALLGVGLIDRVAASEGVLGTYNSMKGPKEVLLMPLSDHDGDYSAFYPKIVSFLNEEKNPKKFPPPFLNWSRNGKALSVSWPVQAADYALEEKLFTGTNGWRKIQPGSTNFGVVSATVPRSSTNRFLRLRK